MKKYQTFGGRTKEESERERKHKALARRAAAEGIVLLKNDGVLPMQPGKIALYGPGSRMTVKGGRGSGDVRERHSVTIEEGLKNAGFSIPTTLWMDRFEERYAADVAAWRSAVEEKIRRFGPARTMKMFILIGESPMPYPACTPVLPDELTDEADTAVYVLARQAGEGKDRRVEKGDYLLSDTETDSLRLLSGHYKKLILVLNCGGVIDLSVLDEIRIDGVLFIGQPGMEGGNALADILTGKVCPSGRLTDTWAMGYEEYPSANTFGHRNGDLENEAYSEGSLVGYRWFDANGITPRFPFGYGLSYTSFAVKTDFVSDKEARVTVTNTGKISGREIVPLFISHHGRRDLAAFAKTKTLAPGECETLPIPYDLKQIASFDENRGCFFLPEGEYAVSTGGSFTLTEERVFPVSRHQPVEKCSERVRKLLETLTDQDKIQLVTGGGYPLRAYNNVMGAAGRTCTTLLKKGVPNIVLADGPAGLNVVPEIAIHKNGMPGYPNGLPEDWRWGWLKKSEPLLKKLIGGGTRVYRYMTAWPSETVLAQSWDTALLEEVGQAVGKEMLEIGVSVWLAPGMNIHRNPLCGRNFEYYAEDPILSGKMAAAVTRGVQSQGGVGVSVKHFCCNNQEDNRTGVSANVYLKTLREIYLRAFEIAIAEGKPWTVMSSYNQVNGRYVCNDPELLTGVLREEWGFGGLVMSDWNATDPASHVAAINAGNDLIMPGGAAVRKALLAGLKNGTLDRAALDRSAGRVLELIFKSETCKDF